MYIVGKPELSVAAPQIDNRTSQHSKDTSFSKNEHAAL